MTNVSEDDLRDRLLGDLGSEAIQDLVDRYVEADSLEESPDMGLIAQLAQKHQEDRLLRVSFTLDPAQYDSLAGYFEETERPGTVLVMKALDEFISLIT